MKTLYLAIVFIAVLNACSHKDDEKQICSDVLMSTIGLCPGMGIDSVPLLMKKLGFDSVLKSVTQKGLSFSVSDVTQKSKKAFFAVIIESRNKISVDRLDLFVSENFDQKFISNLLRITHPKIITTEYSTNYLFKDCIIQRIKLPGAVNYEIKSVTDIDSVNAESGKINPFEGSSLLAL